MKLMHSVPGPTKKKRIALLGGGPSALFLFKKLITSGNKDIEVTIFEKWDRLGSGMPYSSYGANDEHITNVSGNEIPEMVTSISEWTKTLSAATLNKYGLEPDYFNEYKVLPRLFFGMYLEEQFNLLLKQAEVAEISTIVHLNCYVDDVIDYPEFNETWVNATEIGMLKFDIVVVCTGHYWPKINEGKVPRYFDSPYPPAKLNLHLNHPIAIRGSSLTAIDAIRTLARNNGTFLKDEGKLTFELSEHSPNFKICMHSRSGMLPAVRFHLEDSHLSNDSLLTTSEIAAHIQQNGGFLSLDYIFEKNFKDIFKDRDSEFYEQIKEMDMEEFVSAMLALREQLPAFTLLRAEYEQAAKSIKRKESIYWKEMLGVLSFALNYPAKYLSAEDMLRLRNTLMPLISIVIAYVPQSSCEELMALHSAGVLEMITVGEDSFITPELQYGGAKYHYVNEQGEKESIYYQTYVDCIGQPHLSYDEFPFKSMLAKKTISPASIRYQSNQEGENEFERGREGVKKADNGTYYLMVPGISVNDSFQVLDKYGAYNERIYMMAVPYMGGLNPDYSGLDFCEEASKQIVKAIAV